MFMTSKNGKHHSPPTLNHKWDKEVFCHILTAVFQMTLDSPLFATLEEEATTDVFQW